jgi:membrane protease YdiL (CAAX protease family)
VAKIQSDSSFENDVGNSGLGRLRRDALLRAAVFWIGFFACLRLTALLVEMSGVSRADSTAAKQWCGAVLMTILSLLLTRVCLLLDKGRRVDAGIGFARASIVRIMLGLAFGVPLSACSLVCLRWLVPGVRIAFQGFSLRTVLAALGLYLFLAAYEEVGFRGYPMRRLQGVFGTWPTLLIVAPVFALYHISLGWGLLPALLGTGVGSFLFGVAAIAARRGLAFPIGVHAGWNLATWSLDNQGASGLWKMTFPADLAQRVQTVGLVAYVAFMTLGIALLSYWNRRPMLIEDRANLEATHSS